MHKRISLFVLIFLLCLPVTAWAKGAATKKPPEVYFYWGENALLSVTVHPDCSLAGYDGFQLTPIFAKLMQNIMRERGVKVSDVAEITDWREFWQQTNKSVVSPRLYMKVYGEGLLHISGSFVHRSGPDISFNRAHGIAPVLPYIKMAIAPRYSSQDAFVRDLEEKLAP